MTETSPAGAVAHEAVAELLAHLEVSSVAALELTAERRAEQLPEDVAVRLEARPAHTEVGDGRVRLRYTHRATFWAVADDDDGEGACLGLVTCCHEVVFSVSPGARVDEVALRQFAEADGYFMAFPYVRQALQRLAEDVGLPPVVLPVLRRGARPQ